jgi:hypothetical protein
MSEYEFTDRYEALGIPYPNPETMCKGHCDGVGFYPVIHHLKQPTGNNLTISDEHNTDYENAEWLKEHNKTCRSIRWRLKRLFTRYWKSAFEKCDGWHFIKCPDCNGTGKETEQ